MTLGRGPVPITILIVFVVARVAAASQQPANDQAQPTGSSRLTGRVVAADNGQPVRRAYVNISLTTPIRVPTPDHVSGWSVQTDVNGQFEFAGLPAGSYVIFVEPISGFVRPRDPASATLVDNGTAHVTIRLVRAGAIEGRVLDGKGEPVLGANVNVVRRVAIAGYVTTMPFGGNTATNDVGEFRLFNVPAGEYYVVAMYTPRQSNSNPGTRIGYVTTYYPASRTLGDARVVKVRAGQDTKRINVTMASSRLVRVSVHPVSSTGAPLGREARLILSRRDPVYLSSRERYAREERGMFVFDDVSPGDYSLLVTSGLRMEEAAYVNLTVDEQDVALNVQTNTGATVSGRVIVDGQALGVAPGVSPLNVGVLASPPPGQYGISYTREYMLLCNVRGTDRFELTGLRGPMVLYGEIGLGALVSIRRGGQEIAGKTLEFVGTETIDDIVVELTRKVATLEVAVTSTKTPDDPETALVMLFADDPSLWHSGHLQYTRMKTSRTPTRERLIRIVPGRYRVIAIHDADMNFPMSQRALLEKLRPFATPVTLVAGEPAQIAIRVTKLGR
jgi:hypothetical protein